MADIQHTILTSAQCHEPKHISTSLTSQSGMVITPSSSTAGESELRQLIFEDLDLAGSTDSEMHPYGFYKDSTYTSGSPRAFVAATRTKITCDAAHAATVEIDMPAGVSLWDSVTNKITPEYTEDCYNLRVQFKAEPTTTNEDVKLELDIGGAGGVILDETRPLLRGAAENSLVFSWPIFSRSTFVTNGGELYLTCSDATNIWDISVYLVRVRKGGAS